MSTIESFKNSPYSVVKYLKEGHLFQERKRWPPIFIPFSGEATYYIYTWVDYSKIGIIFRIIVKGKILNLP